MQRVRRPTNHTDPVRRPPPPCDNSARTIFKHCSRQRGSFSLSIAAQKLRHASSGQSPVASAMAAACRDGITAAWPPASRRRLSLRRSLSSSGREERGRSRSPIAAKNAWRCDCGSDGTFLAATSAGIDAGCQVPGKAINPLLLGCS